MMCRLHDSKVLCTHKRDQLCKILGFGSLPLRVANSFHSLCRHGLKKFRQAGEGD